MEVRGDPAWEGFSGSSPHSQAFFTSVSQSLCGRPERDSVSSISIQCVRVSLKEREVHRPEESFFRYQQGRGRAFSTLYLSGCQTQLFPEESGRTLVSTSGAVPLSPRSKPVRAAPNLIQG